MDGPRKGLTIHDRIGSLKTLCACVRGIRLPTIAPAMASLPLAATVHDMPLLAGGYLAGGAVVSLGMFAYGFVAFRGVLRRSGTINEAVEEHCIKKRTSAAYTLCRPGYRRMEDYLSNHVRATEPGFTSAPSRQDSGRIPSRLDG